MNITAGHLSREDQQCPQYMYKILSSVNRPAHACTQHSLIFLVFFLQIQLYQLVSNNTDLYTYTYTQKRRSKLCHMLSYIWIQRAYRNFCVTQMSFVLRRILERHAIRTINVKIAIVMVKYGVYGRIVPKVNASQFQSFI